MENMQVQTKLCKQSIIFSPFPVVFCVCRVYHQNETIEISHALGQNYTHTRAYCSPRILVYTFHHSLTAFTIKPEAHNKLWKKYNLMLVNNIGHDACDVVIYPYMVKHAVAGGKFYVR